MLDLFLYDLALHQLQGNNGVTHGRSYMKDKSRAADQDVFGLTKLLFGTTDQPYTSRSDTGADVPGRGRALPAARGASAGWRTSRAHVRRPRRTWARPLDLDQPFTTDAAVAGAGRVLHDPDDIPFWWERGALTAWQTVPATLATIEQHDLFETELFQPFKPLVDIAGGDPAVARAARLLRCAA